MIAMTNDIRKIYAASLWSADGEPDALPSCSEGGVEPGLQLCGVWGTGLWDKVLVSEFRNALTSPLKLFRMESAVVVHGNSTFIL